MPSQHGAGMENKAGTAPIPEKVLSSDSVTHKGGCKGQRDWRGNSRRRRARRNRGSSFPAHDLPESRFMHGAHQHDCDLGLCRGGKREREIFVSIMLIIFSAN